MNSRHKNTSILLSEDIKPWLYRKLHVENRSLSNYLNTMLKREKEQDMKDETAKTNFKEWGEYIDAIKEKPY